MKRIATLAALAAALFLLSPAWGQTFVPVPEPAPMTAPVVVVPQAIMPAVPVVVPAPLPAVRVVGPIAPPEGGGGADPGGYITREELEASVRSAQRTGQKERLEQAALSVLTAPPTGGATTKTSREKGGVGHGVSRGYSHPRRSAPAASSGWSLSRRFAALRADMSWVRERLDGLAATIASIKEAVSKLGERLGLVEKGVTALQDYTTRDAEWAKAYSAKTDGRLAALEAAETARATGLPVAPTVLATTPTPAPVAPAVQQPTQVAPTVPVAAPPAISPSTAPPTGGATAATPAEAMPDTPIALEVEGNQGEMIARTARNAQDLLEFKEQVAGRDKEFADLLVQVGNAVNSAAQAAERANARVDVYDAAWEREAPRWSLIAIIATAIGGLIAIVAIVALVLAIGARRAAVAAVS